MPKICIIEGCENPRWSHGVCKAHNHLRTDDEYKRSLEQKVEKKKAKVKAVIEQAKEKKRRVRINRITTHPNAEIVCSTKDGRITEVFSSQYEMFKSIWDNNDHVSYLSGLPILISENTDLWFSIFAHVLSKAQNRYPEYKLYAKNIVMLTPFEHNLYDQGTIMQRAKYAELHNCSWNKLTALAEELKQQYPTIT